MTAITREPESDVDSMFIDRWSPRAFLPDPIPAHHIRMLFEAARWAPSCNNDQPWRFAYAVTPTAREKFLSALVERNQAWARTAPLLILALARRAFQNSTTINRHAGFDTGAAWMSLALQARRLGLYCHAMAGFDATKAHQVLGTSEQEYDIFAAIAVGRRADPSTLPEPARQRETPNSRKAAALVADEFT
jgi:nitroreductase